MKKILFLFITAILTFAVLGCTPNKKIPLSTEENIEEEPLDYNVEKIVLSKGFQIMEPNVEVIKKNKTLKLLASIGLIEGSGINIDRITKSGKNINIYISRTLNNSETQLTVPQAMIEIYDPIIEKHEDLNFNIISQNYDPISLKFNKNQILEKIYNNFKIEPNTIPNVQLTKLKGEMIWNISFTNIFDKENPKSALVNLDVKVDALTGEILDSVKDTISTYIDDGYLLHYLPNNYLLYKRQHTEKDINYESLWTYNIKTGERCKLYTSRYKISSAIFSPSGQYISLIEVDENKSDIYMIQRSEKVPYKITPINHLQPKLMKWKDDNILYFIDIKDEKSTLLTYSLDENKSTVKFSLDKVIESFDTVDDKLLFTESNPDSLNKKIYLTTNDVDLKEIGAGFKSTFLDDNNLIYLTNTEKEDRNILHIYNFEDNNYKDSLDYNVSNYFKLNEESIIFIEKNTHNNDFSLNKYNINEKSVTPIAKITSDKIFYNPDKEMAYITLCPNYKDNNMSIIYSINLNKLSGIIDK